MPTVLMTGGHAGLGLQAARTLAKRFGRSLILSGRNPERVEQAAKQLRAETGVRVALFAMDLSSLVSVRAGVAECMSLLQARSTGDRELESIVCNAGSQFRGQATYSTDGYEDTFAGNCLGHFLMTNLLLDSVAKGGRLVWTASGTHDPASMDGKTVGAAVEPDANV